MNIVRQTHSIGILKEARGPVALLLTKQFFARKHIVLGVDENSVRLSSISSLFCSYFLVEDFIELEQIKPFTSVTFFELLDTTTDAHIIHAFGGEEAVVTNLSVVYSLLCDHAKGMYSGLRTDTYMHIFYVRDVNGVVRSVGVAWDRLTKGWELSAYPIDDKGCWSAGHHVVVPAAPWPA